MSQFKGLKLFPHLRIISALDNDYGKIGDSFLLLIRCELAIDPDFD